MGWSCKISLPYYKKKNHYQINDLGSHDGDRVKRLVSR